ncbi:hypothetical protein DFH11DRAFT_1731443 [Phellopilus nigrolimitatus]|nr:hypothetical protein DFH11DRAFT_1731443 [Phellopilus nigrolimitatus]
MNVPTATLLALASAIGFTATYLGTMWLIRRYTKPPRSYPTELTYLGPAAAMGWNRQDLSNVILDSYVLPSPPPSAHTHLPRTNDPIMPTFRTYPTPPPSVF